MALCVVDFFEVGDPVIVLVFINDVAGDFHFGQFLVLPVLVFLAHFKHSNCPQLFVFNHVGLLTFCLFVSHLTCNLFEFIILSYYFLSVNLLY